MQLEFTSSSEYSVHKIKKYNVEFIFYTFKVEYRNNIWIDNGNSWVTFWENRESSSGASRPIEISQSVFNHIAS